MDWRSSGIIGKAATVSPALRCVSTDALCFWWSTHPKPIAEGRLCCVPGTGIALGGVFLYSQIKRLQPKTKTA